MGAKRTSEDLIDRWLEKTEHDMEIRAIPSQDRLFSRDKLEIEGFVAQHLDGSVFYGAGSRQGGGTKEHVRQLPFLWADLDFKDYPCGEPEARQRLRSFTPPASVVISTGGGLHALWFLKEAVPPSTDFEGVLRGMSKVLGSDPNVCDIARILRLPNTYNWKTGSPKFVEIELWSDAEYPVGEFSQYQENLSCEAAQARTPRDGSTRDLTEEIATLNSQCAFLEHGYAHREDLAESLWYALVSNLARLPDGLSLIHEFSRGYPGYSERETDQKFLHSLKDTGPHTCNYIRENGFSCPMDCGVKAPIVRLTRRLADVRCVEGTKGEEAPKETMSEKLIRIGSAPVLFHDDMTEAYAEIDGRAMRIRSQEFKGYLAHELWTQDRKAPNSDALNQAINVLEAMACYDGELRNLYTRIAWHKPDILYDLCDGRVVRITNERWEILDRPPIIFRRYPHQKQQVEPLNGGNLDTIFKYVNIIRESDRLLAKILLVSLFVPDIPHPIMHPWGDQGSGKTTICDIFKRLIDPSRLSVFFAPRNLAETVQALEHHYFLAFDNMSDISDWLSDLLAQSVTGAGLSKRKLYTDDEDHIFQVKRCLALNGINQLISRPDLMDRSILLHHERIDPKDRKTEEDLYLRFEEEKPFILGAIFDILAKAMAIYPTVELYCMPRMADFARWGCAIAQAMGHSFEGFLSAYEGNVKTQIAEVVGGNSLAQAVIAFMDEKEVWQGTVQEAFTKLKDIAEPREKDLTFPKAPNKLRKHLERIRPALLDFGVRFDISDYATRIGVIATFQKVSQVSSPPSLLHGTSNSFTYPVDDRVNVPLSTTICPSGSSQETPNDFRQSEGGEHCEGGNRVCWKDPDFIPEDSIPLDEDEKPQMKEAQRWN